MQVSEYLVSQWGGLWTIECPTGQHGPYMNRQMAIDSALGMAKADFSKMKPAIVMLRNNGDLDQIYNSTNAML